MRLITSLAQLLYYVSQHITVGGISTKHYDLCYERCNISTCWARIYLLVITVGINLANILYELCNIG